MLDFNNNCGCDSGSLNGFTDPSCPAPSVVTWNSIQGKPSCFTPCAHTHVPGDIIGLDAYIQSVEYVGAITTTNSIQLTAPAGVLNANLKLSADAGVGYKVPLSILSDGLIGQIPYASGANAGILSSADWTTFNNKFNTPSGTVFQYVRGDGSLATFPVTSGTVTSVGLSMPAAFAVASSPVTTSGVIAVTGAGTISQYIRGDGTLAAFPSFLLGSVPFGNGTGLTENNTKFFWDNTLFKLKLTDSKLEFLNTTYLGSALLEYNLPNVGSGIPTLNIDQTSNNSSGGMLVKLRGYNNTFGNGQITGLVFGTVDGGDTIDAAVGMIWNTINVPSASNFLILRNTFGTTGVISIETNAYARVDGLALTKYETVDFAVSISPTYLAAMPNNIIRFKFGGVGAKVIYLPANAAVNVPEGYIFTVKAINLIGGFPNVTVSTTGTTTSDVFVFSGTANYESVMYRYSEVSDHWDIIAKY